MPVEMVDGAADPVDAPRSFTVPGNAPYSLTSVKATFDGSGAGGDFYAALSVYTQDGKLASRFGVEETVTSGDTALKTFSPFSSSARAGIRTVESLDQQLTVFNPSGPTVQLLPFAAQAMIARDGAAAAQNIANGVLTATTTALQHNKVIFADGITADVASTPSRLVLDAAGLYVITSSIVFSAAAAADYGVCSGYAPGTSGVTTPLQTGRRIVGDGFSQTVSFVMVFAANTTITQAVGQNSGAALAAPIGTLSAARLSQRAL